MTAAKLIVSDVDNTLLGDDQSLRRFAAWYERNRSQVRLVYASGRFYESIVESIQETDLPEPCAIVGGVGTDLRLYPSGRPIFAWDERIDDRWCADLIRRTLASHDRLEAQPSEFQSSLKISYFLRGASPQELEMILATLSEVSIDANLIYSSQRDLDLLPAGINKGSAAHFLAEYFGCDEQDVIVCGDSANDLAMFELEFRGVVVGNAQPELIALEDPLVYKSALPFAAGVLDGLEHWLAQSDQQRRVTLRRVAVQTAY